MTAIYAMLPYRLYRLSGEDTLSFLQGQLTQDMNKLNSHNCLYAAYCDAKANLLASLLILQDNCDYLIRLHEPQAEALIKRLKLFVLRSKVTISASDYLQVGLNKAAAKAFCQHYQCAIPSDFERSNVANSYLCALPNDYFELFVAPSDSDIHDFLATLKENRDRIELLRLKAGHFNVLAETPVKMLAQQTPLQNWGAISYQKGCYVGQEVIARNKYRGKMNKLMAVAYFDKVIDFNENLTVEQQGKAVGQIIEYYRGKEHSVCLAIMATFAIDKTVTVGKHSCIFTVIS